MDFIVTGCSKGIGYEIAIKLLEENHNVFGIARNEGFLKQLSASYTNFSYCALDLNDLSKKKNELLNDIYMFSSHLDGIINNAGFLVNKSFSNTTVEEIHRTFTVNVFSIGQLIQLFLPLMGGLSTTHIVNIGSMAGFQGSSKFNGLTWYSASKAALSGLTEALAQEFKDQNICVNCLALGSVQTEMLSEAFPGFKAPLTPKQMAEFITWFAIHGHTFFNGKTLPISVSTP